MPEVWYDMELEDFFFMQKGFFNKRKDDSMQFAKVGFYIAAIHQNGLAGKALNSRTFYKEWFGEAEKPMTKEQLKERSEGIMKRLDQMQKLEDERIKLGIKKPKKERAKRT